MGQKRNITAHFTSERRFFENSIGKEFDFTSMTGPYEYLLGALSGCFYSTLASFERKSSWKEVTIDVTGIKRDSVPTTLEKTVLAITVTGAEDREEFETLVKKAAEECSIYNTISRVSSMEWTIEYR